MLSVYTRHLPSCDKTEIHDRRCRCPKWIRGKVRPDTKPIRKSAGTGSWEKAEQIARAIETETLTGKKVERVTVSDAVNAFIEDKEAQHLTGSTLHKLKTIFQKQFVLWSQKRGLTFVDEITTHELALFRAGWKGNALTASKKQERVRSFFNFCIDREWLEKNPAKKLSRIKVRLVPTDYFTQQEMEKLVAVTLDETHWTTDQQQRLRTRALMLLMRYSGLRVTDAITLRKERIDASGQLFLYTQKTGVPVMLPLPPFVVALLKEVKNTNPDYFFWSGKGASESARKDWSRTFKYLFEWAQLGKRAHPHMFRDTFAVELLLAGVPIDHVSILLGHSSVKITERHYSPFVKARQQQIIANVMKTWPKAGLTLVQTA